MTIKIPGLHIDVSQNRYPQSIGTYLATERRSPSTTPEQTEDIYTKSILDYCIENHDTHDILGVPHERPPVFHGKRIVVAFLTLLFFITIWEMPVTDSALKV